MSSHSKQESSHVSQWCGSSESGPRGSPFSIPSYLHKNLDKHVLRNFSRFRLRAHHLRVESCKWHGGSSICDKCECGEVQDEKHVLFFCKCAEVCELRMRYRDLFEGMFKTLRAFAPSSSVFVEKKLGNHLALESSDQDLRAPWPPGRRSRRPTSLHQREYLINTH